MAQQLDLVCGGVPLASQLTVPPEPRGLVVFVHGTGSSLASPRNRQVADQLQSYGLATLLFDQLSAAEQQQGLRFTATDLRLLVTRVVAVLDAINTCEAVAALPLGLFGASTGAALALVAAAQRPNQVKAVVSRGGRPDLVPAVLGDVVCPTLLLVGSQDLDVLELNTWAAASLQGRHELRVVPGGGHLFAEPGCLALVAEWSAQWFLQHLIAADVLSHRA
jgi:putative phosphoribosyl transferase